MIQAWMNWPELELKLLGHANQAEPGKDIVCAAESMLTHAMLQTLIELEEEQKMQLEWDADQVKGRMRIRAVPVSGREREIRMCFRVCVTGMRMLEETYPEYIKLKEEE